MRVFLTEEEILDLAMTYLDKPRPDSDFINAYATKMDMVYCDELGMWEDVEEHSLTVRLHKAKMAAIDQLMKNITD